MLRTKRLDEILHKKFIPINLNVTEQVVTKSAKQEVLLLLHFWRHLTQIYYTDPKI
jgi:hypothetical protein